MCDIKTDSKDHKICRGCLSSDRRLTSVAAGHIYYSLLTEDQKGQALSNTHTKLCWECVATLRKMQTFQAQIQRAHTVMENSLGLSPVKPTLSSLSIHCKSDYDDIFEENVYAVSKITQIPNMTVEKIVIPTKYKAQVTEKEIKIPRTDEDVNFVEIPSIHSDDFETEYLSDYSDDYKCLNDKVITSSSPEITTKRINSQQTLQKAKKTKRPNQNDVIVKKEVTESQFNPNNNRKKVYRKKQDDAPIIKTPIITKLELELQKFMLSTKNDAFKMNAVTASQKKESKVSIDTHAKTTSKNVDTAEAAVSDVSAEDAASTYDDIDSETKRKLNKPKTDSDPDFRLDEDGESSASEHGQKENLDDNEKETKTKRRFNKTITVYKHVGDVLSCFTETEMSWSDLKSTLDYEDAIVDTKKPFKCSICGMLFKLSTSRKRHAVNWHKGRYPDLFKKGSFQNPSPFLPEKPCLWRCRICSRMLRREHLVTHVNELHRTQYFCNGDGCEWTQKCFWTKNDHVQHWEEIHKKFSCDVCGTKKIKKCHIEMHMRKHFKLPKPPNAPLPCPHCERTFDSKSALYAHARSRHTPAELRYCVECDFTFGSVWGLRNHVLKKHTPTRQRYPCTECGKVFATKAAAQSHYDLFHVGRTNYRCHICKKYFSRLQALQWHLNAHNNIKLPKTKRCTICERMFQNNRQLRFHTYTHTGERPYKCEHCDAAFTQPHCLRVHLAKRHGGAGPGPGEGAGAGGAGDVTSNV